MEMEPETMASKITELEERLNHLDEVFGGFCDRVDNEIKELKKRIEAIENETKQ